MGASIGLETQNAEPLHLTCRALNHFKLTQASEPIEANHAVRANS